jgi:ectoine hydroxylase-related dioxygenase (phytanoyl-CoA dioxygenase family)
MNAQQKFIFDLQGYITVENALDKQQLLELNELLDRQVAQNVKPAASSHRFWDSLLGWGKVYRDLIDNPRITPFIETLVGPDFRLDHDYLDILRKGTSETSCLHGGTTRDASHFFRYKDGEMFSGLTVVAYNLRDVNVGDGGFGCIPGSHKANFELPGHWRDLRQPVDCVRAIPGPAGTAIIFTEALIHGTLPWMGKHERRTLFYKYSPTAISWRSQYYNPDNFSDLSTRQRAILEAPNARYSYRKKPGLFQLK